MELVAETPRCAGNRSRYTRSLAPTNWQKPSTASAGAPSADIVIHGHSGSEWDCTAE